MVSYICNFLDWDRGTESSRFDFLAPFLTGLGNWVGGGGGGSSAASSTHAAGIVDGGRRVQPSRAEEEERGPHVLLCAEILAANFRSDGYKRIQGGRYSIYRPPRNPLPSTPESPDTVRPCAGLVSPPPPRLTSSAPPRPSSLHLELPKLKANVLLRQRSRHALDIMQGFGCLS